ncbi:MAG: hypothetical protein V3V09_02155, partial [Arenicellales bacterium]
MLRFPLWKYIIILIVCAVGFLYAVPNLFGDDPGIQMRGSRGLSIERSLVTEIEQVLQENNLSAKGISFANNNVEIRFDDNETQFRAREKLEAVFGKTNTVALTLLPAAPQWMTDLGLSPMNLGLDLRGGVHFLLEVDLQSAVNKSRDRALTDIKAELRKAGVRYKSVKASSDGSIDVLLRQAKQLDQAKRTISRNLTELTVADVQGDTGISLDS